MGRMSRTKGAVGEREWAAVLTAAGYPAHRGRQYSGGADSPDVCCDAMADVHWEVKRTERLSVYKAMQQAIADAGDGEWPAVAHRSNGNEWLVVMRASDWLELYRRTHVQD